MTVGVRTYAKAKRQRNAQGHACRQAYSDNSWPATAELQCRRRSSRGHGARREPVANPAGSPSVPGSGKPWQEGGLCGRKTWQAVCPHRPSGDAGARRGRSGARRALGEARAHPNPGTRAGRRRPAARRRRGQTGRRRKEEGEQRPWRHGTTRHGPGAPKGFLPPPRTPAGRTGVTPRPLHSPFAGSLLLGHGGGAAAGS